MAILAPQPTSAGADPPEFEAWVNRVLEIGPEERVLDLSADLARQGRCEGGAPFSKVFAVSGDPVGGLPHGALKVLRLLLASRGSAYFFVSPRVQEEAFRVAGQIGALFWDAGLDIERIEFAEMGSGWAACVVAQVVPLAPDWPREVFDSKGQPTHGWSW